MRDIRETKKIQNFDLENEGQGIEERDLRHSTGNVRIHVGDFLEFHLPGYIRLLKLGHTHTLPPKHIHTQTQKRSRLMTKGAKYALYR